MNARLLEKIEELTLHLINQHKEFATKEALQQEENAENRRKLKIQDDQIKVLIEKLNKIIR